MKHLLPVLVFLAMANVAHAACDLSSITGHENNQWSVEINVKNGTYSQTLDTDKAQKKSGTAEVSCDAVSVRIRQTSATDGHLCTYDLKRNGTGVSGPYTCSEGATGQTFAGIGK